MINARSDWKLVTFDLYIFCVVRGPFIEKFHLESYFRTFAIYAIYFEWLDLATSFSVWRYVHLQNI